MDEKALRDYLKQKEPLLGDEIPATQPILDRMTKYVREFLKSDAIVAKLEGSGNLSVIFRPSSLPSVAEITFRGNTAIRLPNSSRSYPGRGLALFIPRTGSARFSTPTYAPPTRPWATCGLSSPPSM